jgi:hypothetical protein
MAQKSRMTGVDAALAFLKKLDEDKALRDEMRKLTHHLEVAQKHNFHFTNDDLQKALVRYWGVPKGREGKDDPHTCCCISEVPGY